MKESNRLAERVLAERVRQKGRDVLSLVLDANAVVFGAILSAYAGVMISKLDDTLTNAFLIFVLCFLHVIFLFSSFILSIKRYNLTTESKWLYGSLVLSSMVIAAAVWRYTFPTHYIYTSILIGWFVCQYLLSGIVANSVFNTLDDLREEIEKLEA